MQFRVEVFLYFSGFIFNEDHVFIEEDNPLHRAVIVEEELYDIAIDDIGINSI